MSPPDAATTAQLLLRYRPVMQFDSQESYMADLCAALTDYTPAEGGRRNLLKSSAGSVLAAAGDQPQLRLATLTGSDYVLPTQVAVGHDDYIDAVGQDYVTQARRMHRTPGYADTIHGHAVVGEDGHLWLQYWFFHYYNDKAFLGIGLHEGDWEMIQLRLGDDLAPTDATYAQHNGGERCAYSKLELAASPDGQVPVVYSGRGSHASYFTKGSHPTELEIVIDHNDGLGRRLRPALIDMRGLPWAAWPGRWGSTRADGTPGSADSPRGPVGHGQFTKPVKFHDACDQRDDAPEPPKAAPAPPTVSARRLGDRAVITWNVGDSPHAAPPAKVLLTVSSPEHDGRPPATFAVDAAAGSGEYEHPLPLERHPAYDVIASAVAADGAASATVTEPVERPVHPH